MGKTTQVTPARPGGIPMTIDKGNDVQLNKINQIYILKNKTKQNKTYIIQYIIAIIKNNVCFRREGKFVGKGYNVTKNTPRIEPPRILMNLEYYFSITLDRSKELFEN